MNTVRLLAAAALLSLSLPLAGCVVADPGYAGPGPGPRFCANHPYNWRCR